MGTPTYDRQNTRRINLKLNNKTDADIIRKLESQENIQGYIKSLIRDKMKEERKMTSKLFYRGHMVSEIAYNNMINDMMETADDALYERLESSFLKYMNEHLEQYDSRLWWQPETSEVFWDDYGTGEMPDEDGFEDWWKETVSDWYELAIQ